jgi:alkylation response protein AidB-like acyl-CoA dehydrogenase
VELSKEIKEIIQGEAIKVDTDGAFPTESIKALMKAGYYGLISSEEVGGSGKGIAEAASICEHIAELCASTAMITCMHYSATAVIEKFGGKEVREAIARGEHLSTLAFSEVGSRSHFWAPVSTATEASDGQVSLSGKKSWITSVYEADSYVWSSKPLSAEGHSSIWLVPRKSNGLSIQGRYVGLGLRGNDSCPVNAESVLVPKSSILSADGAGFDVMMGVVLPIFSLLGASISIGVMKSALKGAIGHVSKTELSHLGQSIADFPTVRSYLAKAQIKMDSAIALRNDAISAILTGREDTMLRVLEIKACAGETALEVSDIAMRVCGGAAYRKEVGVERSFRDARAAFIMAPTSDALYDFIGKAICGMPLF